MIYRKELKEMLNERIGYERNLTGSVMKISANNNSQFDEKIMLKRKLPGLLPVEKCYIDGEGQYWYNISGKQSLDSYCRIQEIDVDFINKIILSICSEIEILEMNLLDINSLMLSPETIFITNYNGEIIFTLYPGAGHELEQEFRELMEYVITKIDHNDSEAVEAAYDIYNKSMDEAYTIMDIREVILESKHQAVYGQEANMYNSPTTPLVVTESNGVCVYGSEKNAIYNYDSCNFQQQMSVAEEIDSYHVNDKQGKYKSVKLFDNNFNGLGKNDRNDKDDKKSQKSDKKNNKKIGIFSSKKEQKQTLNNAVPNASLNLNTSSISNNYPANQQNQALFGKNAKRNMKSVSPQGGGLSPRQNTNFSTTEQLDKQSGKLSELFEKVKYILTQSPQSIGTKPKSDNGSKRKQDTGAKINQNITPQIQNMSASLAASNNRSNFTSNEKTKKPVKSAKPGLFGGRKKSENKVEQSFLVSPQEEMPAPVRVPQIHPTVCLSDYVEHPQGLLLYEGTEAIDNITLCDSLTKIGQGFNVDAKINKPTVSHLHAQIQQENSEFFIEDLNSTNGTFINGEILSYKERKQLKRNDIIKFADVKYRFV